MSLPIFLMRCLRVLPFACFVGLVSCGDSERGGFQGYILGEYVQVSAPVSGQLFQVDAVKGAWVEEGVQLFQLDPCPAKYKLDQYAGLLEQAQFNLENAKKGWRVEEVAVVQHAKAATQAMQVFAGQELARSIELFKTQVVTEQNLDLNRALDHALKEVVAVLGSLQQMASLGGRPDELAALGSAVKALQAQVEEARWRLEEKAQKAPVAGLVHDVYYRRGERVAEGKPVVSLLPPGEVRVRFYVPQKEVPGLAMRQGVEVFSGEAKLEAKITFISTQAEYAPPVIFSTEHSEKLVFMAEASFSPEVAKGLHPGQPVEVRAFKK